VGEGGGEQIFSGLVGDVELGDVGYVNGVNGGGARGSGLSSLYQDRVYGDDSNSATLSCHVMGRISSV